MQTKSLIDRHWPARLSGVLDLDASAPPTERRLRVVDGSSVSPLAAAGIT